VADGLAVGGLHRRKLARSAAQRADLRRPAAVLPLAGDRRRRPLDHRQHQRHRFRPQLGEPGFSPQPGARPERDARRLARLRPVRQLGRPDRRAGRDRPAFRARSSAAHPAGGGRAHRLDGRHAVVGRPGRRHRWPTVRPPMPGRRSAACSGCGLTRPNASTTARRSTTPGSCA
jgi:hypothetical protein